MVKMVEFPARMLIRGNKSDPWPICKFLVNCEVSKNRQVFP
jgi:hypothetical protein